MHLPSVLASHLPGELNLSRAMHQVQIIQLLLQVSSVLARLFQFISFWGLSGDALSDLSDLSGQSSISVSSCFSSRVNLSRRRFRSFSISSKSPEEINGKLLPVGHDTHVEGMVNPFILHFIFSCHFISFIHSVGDLGACTCLIMFKNPRAPWCGNGAFFHSKPWSQRS